jgi:spore germination cell wall hydrolase CwlJ-like protein
MEFSIKTLYKLLGLCFVSLVLYLVMSIKIENINDTPIFKSPKSYVSITNVDKTLDCLALNIYREAGHESFEGKVAVAQVTLNRVDHHAFPKDVCGVVYQKNVIMEKVVCQFSWHCMTFPQHKPNDAAYKESYAVAKKVLLEGFRLDSLEKAIYYHAVYVKPNWPYVKITQIGNHIFYKERT